MSALPTIGSAGKAHGYGRALGPRLVLGRSGDLSSFCLICASWFFNEHRSSCTKCGAPIFRWVAEQDLRHFRSTTSLGGF